MNRILAFAGSARKSSLNQRVIANLARLATEAGGDVRHLTLGELNLPIYHADEEAAGGLPIGAATLKDAIKDSAGLLIGCPEYNGFMSPLLLNAIDWATRSDDGKPDLTPFAGKVVLVCSASPGGFGGMRAAAHLRTLLSGIGCLVLPETVVVPGAMAAFNEDGSFASEAIEGRARHATRRLIEVATRLG